MYNNKLFVLFWKSKKYIKSRLPEQHPVKQGLKQKVHVYLRYASA